MSLLPQLNDELKAAMRARDAQTMSTIRLLLSAMNYARIELGHTLTDDEELQVVTRQAKQRRESIEQFTLANRPELVAKETTELHLLERYLPTQLSRDEIIAEARAAIAESGAAGPSDLGKVMGPLSRKLRGRADGNVVRDVVVGLLGGGR
jgi:uncharacterized protein YqeY